MPTHDLHTDSSDLPTVPFSSHMPIPCCSPMGWLAQPTRQSKDCQPLAPDQGKERSQQPEVERTGGCVDLLTSSSHYSLMPQALPFWQTSAWSFHGTLL